MGVKEIKELAFSALFKLANMAAHASMHPSRPPRSNFSVAHSGARRKNWKEVRPALDDIPPMSPAAIQKEADSKASAVLRAMVDPTVVALKAVAMAGGWVGGRCRAGKELSRRRSACGGRGWWQAQSRTSGLKLTE